MFSISKQEPRRGIWHQDIASSPPPGPGEITVDVTKAGICGTDFHIYNWDAWSAERVQTSLTIGHEFVGVVSAVAPDVIGIVVGQRVSAECHITCGHCFQCRTERAHLCANTQIIGVDRAGCFAETVTVPARNAWPVPDDIPDHHAAVFDPVGNAMHAVSEGKVSGRDVLVIGAGAIGLFAAAIAKSYGARQVIVQEPNPSRAAIARAIGVDGVVDPRSSGSAAEIMQATGGLGPEVILEMSGNPVAIRSALELARNGATVVLLGLPAEPVELNLSARVIMKSLRLQGVTGRRMFETWYRVEAFMRKSPDLMDRIITHILPASQYSEGFKLIEEGRCGKVVLNFKDAGRHAIA